MLENERQLRVTLIAWLAARRMQILAWMKVFEKKSRYFKKVLIRYESNYYYLLLLIIINKCLQYFNVCGHNFNLKFALGPCNNIKYSIISKTLFFIV